MNDYNNQKKDDEALGSFYMGKGRGYAEPKRKFPKGLMTIVILAGFAAILWYAYPRGEEKYTELDIPVIKADTTPIKTEPVDPGGIDIPHQDSTVFDPLDKKASGEVEKLVPSSEEPMNKDEIVKGAEVAAPAATPVIEEKPAIVAAPPAKEVTKEVKKATPKKEEPVVSTDRSYIQLGSYRDIAGAKTDWEKIKKKHPDLLAKLTMKTEKVDIPAKGVFYRLQAGKVSETRAREICNILKNEKFVGGCIVLKNKG